MRIILAFCLLNNINLSISPSVANTILQFVEGHECSPANCPYVVSIETIIIYRHVCGGSLVGSKWVLSAAHCKKSNDEKHVVVAGLPALMYGRDFITPDFIQESEVLQWYIHPKFFRPLLANDVCLLKLKKTMDQSLVIKRTSLYLKEFPPSFESDCSNSLVLGFGWKDESGKKLTRQKENTRHLRYANVSVLRDIECTFLPHYTQFCAKDKSSSVESVNPGDSGGPLICNGKQIGIISGYNPTTKHSLFVKVYLYKDFIYDTMASNICKFKLSVVCALLDMFILINKMLY